MAVVSSTPGTAADLLVTPPFDALVLQDVGSTGAYWTLEDPVGTATVADASGNGHTLTGGATFTFGSTGIVPSDSLTSATAGASAHIVSTYAPSFSGVTVGCITQPSSLPTSVVQTFLSSFGSNIGVQIYAGTAGNPACEFGNGTTVQSTGNGVDMIVGHTYLLVATWGGITVHFYQYDLTAGTSATNSNSFSGAYTSNAFSISGAALPVVGSIGRAFVIPSALSSTRIALYASTATSAVTGSILSSNYLTLQDSTASGGATFYAGANSTNVSNNSGWFFSNYTHLLPLLGTGS